MSEVKVKINIIRNWQDAKTFYTLVFLVAFSLVLYIFLIGQTVFRLVESRDIEFLKRNLTTEISTLELETLSMDDNLTIDRAYELGFVPVSGAKFVSLQSFVSVR